MVVLFLEKIPIKTWIPLFFKNWIFRAMIRIVRKYSILVELTFRVYTYVDFVNLAYEWISLSNIRLSRS